jgi:hypothetical protein
LLSALGSVLIPTLAVLGASDASAATRGDPHPGPDHRAAANPAGRQGFLGPSDPTGEDFSSGVKFFTDHLDDYHYNKPLAGFQGMGSHAWAYLNDHFFTTGLETFARALEPTNAPAVPGDTWQETNAPQGNGDEGDMSSQGVTGQDLYFPVYPDAGPTYFAKWLSASPQPTQAGPAGFEAARRELTPSNGYPPERNDHWRDRRPGPNTPPPPVLLPAPANDGAKQASGVAGSAFDQVNTNFIGGHSGHDEHASGNAGPKP